MRALSAGLQDHLNSGATTLCWCWRITRNDGTAFGFTDHDHDLAFDGTLFEAASGFTGSEISGAVGLNVDTLDVEGALQSDKLNEADLAAGLFDNARIEIYRVNWADPSMRVHMRYGNLGEVSRGGVISAARCGGSRTRCSSRRGASSNMAATRILAIRAARSLSARRRTLQMGPWRALALRRAASRCQASAAMRPTGSRAGCSPGPPARTTAAPAK